MRGILSIFCRHEWSLKDKTVLPSAYEIGKEMWDRVTKCETMGNIFEQTLVLTFFCQKCGKLKIDKTTS